MALSNGSKLGPYEIVAPLGVGGMGEVYRAKDPRLGREVALKVLPDSFAEDADRLRRFEQEARAASSLNHPNIVTIHEIGSAAGATYLAMELVDGVSLRELLASGPMPPKRMLDVAVQIAEALAKAHGAGIVHRDLKPENVMVSRDGYVKLLDFGLAKLFVAPGGDETAAPTAAPQHTLPGSVMGTVGYMSPEQASGRPVDFRSDQFALGSILYEMATGKRAFQRPTGAQTMAAIIQDEPEPVAQVSPKTAPPFRWIVERCLAKDADERYASTRDLARDLKSVREHLGEVTTSASGTVAVVEPAREVARAVPLVVALRRRCGDSRALGGSADRRGRPADLPAPDLPARHRAVDRSLRPGRQLGLLHGRVGRGVAAHLLAAAGSPESSVLPLPPAACSSISPARRDGDPSPQPNYETNGFTTDRHPGARAALGCGAQGGAPNVTFAEWAAGGTELAVAHYAGGKDRLEFPIGKVLVRAGRVDQATRASPRTGARSPSSSTPGAGDDGNISDRRPRRQEDGAHRPDVARSRG